MIKKLKNKLSKSLKSFVFNNKKEKNIEKEKEIFGKENCLIEFENQLGVKKSVDNINFENNVNLQLMEEDFKMNLSKMIDEEESLKRNKKIDLFDETM